MNRRAAQAAYQRTYGNSNTSESATERQARQRADLEQTRREREAQR